MTPDLPEILASHARTASQANVTMTVPVDDMRALLPLARLGHLYLQATEAWAAVGRTTPQDLPVRLTPKREAELAAVQDAAKTRFHVANAALYRELLAYRQDHP